MQERRLLGTLLLSLPDSEGNSTRLGFVIKIGWQLRFARMGAPGTGRGPSRTPIAPDQDRRLRSAVQGDVATSTLPPIAQPISEVLHRFVCVGFR